jgi:glutamine amidotransferase
VIAIVDTGRGNLLSICNALEYLGADPVVCKDPGPIEGAERVIVPGVGAFGEAMGRLRARGFTDALDQAHERGVPTMGVCLGMQLLARGSEESPGVAGLGWIEADVTRLSPPGLAVPHIGWNDVTYNETSPLYRGLPPHPDFYFVHSYHLVPDRPEIVDATTEYGVPFVASIRQSNVFAVQFHPEKSQDHGLAVLEHFLEWDPSAC